MNAIKIWLLAFNDLLCDSQQSNEAVNRFLTAGIWQSNNEYLWVTADCLFLHFVWKSGTVPINDLSFEAYWNKYFSNSHGAY